MFSFLSSLSYVAPPLPPQKKKKLNESASLLHNPFLFSATPLLLWSSFCCWQLASCSHCLPLQVIFYFPIDRWFPTLVVECIGVRGFGVLSFGNGMSVEDQGNRGAREITEPAIVMSVWLFLVTIPELAGLVILKLICRIRFFLKFIGISKTK